MEPHYWSRGQCVVLCSCKKDDFPINILIYATLQPYFGPINALGQSYGCNKLEFVQHLKICIIGCKSSPLLEPYS